MDVPKPFPSAVTACLMLVSIGVTCLSQAGVPDQEIVGAYTPDVLIANETNRNTLSVKRWLQGERPPLKPVGSLLPPQSIDFV
jgi:hypothetical protein